MRVLVTDPIADAGVDRLREAGHEVELATDLSRADLVAAVGDANALIVRSGTTVDRELFEAAPDLVVVARAGIGVDNVDVEAATDHGVVVANAPEGNVRAAAEHTVAMAFAAARSIPQAHARLRAGEWAKDDYLGTELAGATAGLVGLGRVGQEVAAKLDALDVEVLAYDPYISEERADRVGADLVDLDSCLSAADVLSIHTPLTDETEGLIGAEELRALGAGYVVNCARGGIVDEAALASAVEDGPLRGAAVDVFAEEPVAEDNPLLAVEDVVVTPHLGASTEAAQETVATSAAEAVLAAFDGEPVATALNAPSVEEAAFDRLRPYVDLAETAGRMAAGLLDGRVADVEVRYEGDIAEEEVDLATASALAGVFAPLEWRVNAVNADRVADERGVEVTESRRRQSEDFRSLLTVTVGDGDREVTVSGTLFADDEPRIVAVDGYRVDAVPGGQMLVVRNADEPGVIGLIGTVLGDAGINIAGMFNGRETIGGEALTIYSLDDPVPGAVRDRIAADDRVVDVRYVALDGADAPDGDSGDGDSGDGDSGDGDSGDDAGA